jgi:ADP-ribosyl-[dinitrogen reductase] hydrolase
MTLCPGKHQADAASGSWSRNLETDLRDIRRWGGRHIVSLLMDQEMTELGIPHIGKLSLAQGMQWHQVRVPDGGVPDRSAEETWKRVSAILLTAISNGESILFHCKGGLGRTGMFAARFLSENGLEPGGAVGKVREARPGAIETSAQEQNVHRTARSSGPFTDGIAEIGTWSRDQRPSLRERFRGALLGGAMGDALGAAVEFHSYEKIQQEHGEEGITSYAPAYGRIGAITDDTQMTMFTAEGCIRSYTRWLDRGLCSPEGVIQYAYERWLTTQGETVRSEDGLAVSPDTQGWLIGVKDLHNRRAPGATCMAGIKNQQPVRDSKGCGGVMRTAPVGLLGATKVFSGSIFQLGSDAAGITHGHPTGYIAGGAMARLIEEVVQGESLQTACERLLQELNRIQDAWEVVAALKSALNMAERREPDPNAIPRLGEGWIAEEALAIGVYAALVTQSIEEAVVLAVNHSGDSDSTGSIAGQIKGAELGLNSIQESWLQDLELRSEIDLLATDLHSLSYGGKGSAPADRFDEKYPPN